MRLLGLSMQALICIAVAACHAAANIEGDALYAFRRQLQDPMNVLQSWDLTLVNPCTWFHVTCDSNNHVIRLDLGNAGLHGALVPQLGRLTHLQYLELYKNDIVGSIPKELGNLRSLISLDLYDNNLSGALPPSLANLQSLRVLRLNGNRLTGKIPAQYTRLSSLQMLDLSDNDLSGTIPTSGSLYKFGLRSFLNNPRLDGPQLRVKRGSISYNLGS